MTRTPARLVLALTASILGAGLAPAQTPPAPAAPAADAAFAAQKSAFLALPPATRKAAQDALVWLGFYNGANDGDFGKRTRDAIVAWQRSVKATPDGVLGPTLLQALTAAADKARAEVGFKVVGDPKTGRRIGAPTKLMGKPGGARLDFASSADADLAALYARLSAETPTRKVAYKAMKPGVFFVVSGQDGAAKFYSRFETSEGASPPVRGFTFSYPAAQASQLDRVAIAVANSFEAFPGQAPASAPVDRAVSVSRRLARAEPQRLRDGAGHRTGPGADGADPRRLPQRQHRRQACPLRAYGRRDGPCDPRRRFRRKGRTAAPWGAQARSRRAERGGRRDRCEFRVAHRRRCEAARLRLARKRRERRPGVRSRGRPRRPRRADRGRAEADRRRRAGRAAIRSSSPTPSALSSAGAS